MKKAIISFTSLILLALIIGCAADVILEPPETLEGNYEGVYILRVRNVDVTSQRITWIFTENNWNLFVDVEHHDFDTSFCLCEAYGQYLLEDRLRLQVDRSQPKSFFVDDENKCTSCNVGFVPDGLFLMDRSTDTLVMSQQTTTDTLKQIRLLKVFDTE
jgi:hypothetical protein